MPEGEPEMPVSPAGQAAAGLAVNVNVTALPEIGPPLASVTVTVIAEELVLAASRLEGLAVTATEAAVCLMAAPVALVLPVLAS